MAAAGIKWRGAAQSDYDITAADQTAYLKEAVGFYKGYLAVEQRIRWLL